MEQRDSNNKIPGLKIAATAFVFIVVGLCLFSFKLSNKLADDIWSQLGLSQQQGNDKIKNSFLRGYFDYYGARNAKNIAAGNRGAVAKNLLTYSKRYVSSAPFKSEYEKLRNMSKPLEPVIKTRTKEDIRKEKIEETQQSMKEAEARMKKMDAEMQQTMKSVLDNYNKKLKDYQDPNSKMIEIMYQSELRQQEYEKERYQKNLKRWETDYPADHKEVIKMRIQKYLTLAATVDFSAGLVMKDGKKRFEKQEYERKSADWKMIYRAGKEVYDATKVFAEQWLKELQ